MATNRATKKLKAEIFAWFASEASKEWTFVFSHKSLTTSSAYYAEVDYENKIITINPQKTLLLCINSIIHEVLHIIRPNSREKTILRWEQEIREHLSPLETASLLYAVFGSKVVWDD